MLPGQPRVEIGTAETISNGICRQSRVIRLRWCAKDSGRTNQGGRNIEEDGTHRENKAWGGGVRMGGNNMGKGIIVIQIVDPGFMGDLKKETKLGQQERQIPGDPGDGGTKYHRSRPRLDKFETR